MQEIKKRRIVLASVLKPVDDTRMFEKMGMSLARKYEVHILGIASKQEVSKPGIAFHPHAPFYRLSFKRIITPWIVFLRMLKLAPEHVIITTHELLVQGFLLKLLTKAKVYYDVQENYYMNILHTSTFPSILRPTIATYVRVKERLMSRWIEQFILAERTYLDELPFTENKATVIENKFAYDDSVAYLKNRADSPRTQRFLFTGTISKSTGVFEAIKLVSLFHHLNENVSLTIAGYAARNEELQALRNLISGKNYISLIGGDSLVPHSQILSLIAESDVGIISYPPNKAIQHRIPTKLYEYMACRLPVLASNVFPWAELVYRFQAGIIYNPAKIEVAAIMQSLSENVFYPTPIPDILWKTEEETLFSLFDEANGNN